MSAAKSAEMEVSPEKTGESGSFLGTDEIKSSTPPRLINPYNVDGTDSIKSEAVNLSDKSNRVNRRGPPPIAESRSEMVMGGANPSSPGPLSPRSPRSTSSPRPLSPRSTSSPRPLSPRSTSIISPSPRSTIKQPESMSSPRSTSEKTLSSRQSSPKSTSPKPT